MGEPSFTIFSDAPITGWAEGFAALLREGQSGNVNIVDSLDAALDADAEVLVLNLARRGEEKLPIDRVAALKKRRVIAMAPGADWLCSQLDEIEFRGSNVTGDMSMRVVDSEVLGQRSVETPIRPFKQLQDAPSAEWTPETPRVYFSANVADYGPGIDSVLVPTRFDYGAVVVRHANFVMAGVRAHPEVWSEEYRTLVLRLAESLARRPVEDLRPIIVERQIHPPGTVRFALEPISASGTGSHRMFYFRFEQPTVFTATLEHNGSNAMALVFSGGKQHLHATRADTETGETLVATATIGESAIQAVGYRYWSLYVQNFDHENASNAKLSVRYNTVASEAPILGLPGNASFEYINWLAWQHCRAGSSGSSAQGVLSGARGDLGAACLATAREHGFEAWEDLEAHVRWRPEFDMQDGTVGADDFHAEAKARYGDSFGMARLIEYTGDFTDDLCQGLTDAFDEAVAAGHLTFTGEHLLLALLDNPVAAHALSAVGAVVDVLRDALTTAINTASAASSGDCEVSKTVYGAVYRANFIAVLGREGTNAGNLLAGLLGEACQASDLSREQGIHQRDIGDYVTHGVRRVAGAGRERGATVLDDDVERVTCAALAKAHGDGSRYLALDHLLLAMIDEARIGDTLRSMGVRTDELREELAGFIGATTIAGSTGDSPRPTRAFNRVIQMAVAKARSTGRTEATNLDLLWAIGGEPDVSTADFLARHEIDRAAVAACIDEEGGRES